MELQNLASTDPDRWVNPTAPGAHEWWYIDEHPTIIEEVITQKDFKKSK